MTCVGRSRFRHGDDEQDDADTRLSGKRQECRAVTGLRDDHAGNGGAESATRGPHGTAVPGRRRRLSDPVPRSFTVERLLVTP
jgi:hypothetical protein